MAGSSSMTSDLLEKRLRVIERQLGIDVVVRSQDRATATATTTATATETETATATTKKSQQDDEDVVGRLRRVEAKWHETVMTAPKLQATHDAWIESLQAVEELDPGTALTHQQQFAAPLLYRRQEVLANAPELAVDLERLSTIVSLLLVGQGGGVTPAKNTQGGSGTSGKGGGSVATTGSTPRGDNLTASQVTNAPILVGPRVSDEDVGRLARLAESLCAAQERVDRITQTLDRILHQYQSVLRDISEKTVLLDAELARRGV